MDRSLQKKAAKASVWAKPQLIIIGRSKPEESVLSGCKSHALPNGTLSTATKTNCNNLSGNCGACQSNGGNVS